MTNEGHDWENVVSEGPTRVHWCRKCGRLVCNFVEEAEDTLWQTGSEKRTTKNDCEHNAAVKPEIRKPTV